VFPATLLLDTQIRLALDVARDVPSLRGATPHPVKMTHVKMRSFIVPSQRLALGVELTSESDGTLKAMLSATTGERTVASARLWLAADAANSASSDGPVAVSAR
jgi:3-hydroxymyristoyl/3-hydroxydecanoyl-(acyl carrier protein) dehydratase